MYKKILFVFIFLFSSLPLFADSDLDIQIDFPYGEDSIFGVTMYNKGIIGPAAKDSDTDFPMTARITVTNKTKAPLQNLHFKFNIEEPLIILNGTVSTPHQFEWGINELKPGETDAVKLNIKRPSAKEVKTDKANLLYTLSYLKEKTSFEIKNSYLISIQDSDKKWIPWLILFIGPIALLLLMFFGNYKNIFLNYSTSDIVTTAIFISFYVAGSIFTQILKTLGAPSLIVHLAWIVYLFVIMLCLVRLVPKKGVILIFTFGSAVILNTLLWGFNLIHTLTYTVGSAVILEIWFYFTGYGRTFFSAFGSGILFVIYPVSYFWLFTAPHLYHHFYSVWYIQLWLGMNLFNYSLAAFLGYLFSRRIIKVVR